MTQCERTAAEALKEGIVLAWNKQGIKTYEREESAQELLDEC